MKIALVTPAGARSRAGNRHTATRWAAFLRAAGHRVAVLTEWLPDRRADLMLALHARRSHASMRAFREHCPDRPLLLALTGTDVYRDIRISAEARESLRLADRFIVLQAMAIRELPPLLRDRAQVVVQSCASTLRHSPVARCLRLSVIGHLREEKDPLCALRALELLPREAPIELIQIGEALDARFAALARAAMKREPRYRWLGSVPHARALRWLATSHAMVISSRLEGGANVVSEAIRIGTPVLASRIPGNLGLLGSDYPAVFAPGNARALAALVERMRSDATFYRALRRWLARLRPMVAPQNEARLLLGAVRTTARGS